MSAMNSAAGTVKIRMSDTAVLAGGASLICALAVLFFPRTFPELLKHVFYAGYFYRTLAILLVALNQNLFVMISRKRGQKTSWSTSGYIAFLTITFVVVFRAMLILANDHAQLLHLSLPIPTHEGLGAEELLIYTHLGLISGIFLPYLLVRLTQNYVDQTEPESVVAKARHTVAGQ